VGYSNLFGPRKEGKKISGAHQKGHQNKVCLGGHRAFKPDVRPLGGLFPRKRRVVNRAPRRRLDGATAKVKRKKCSYTLKRIHGKKGRKGTLAGEKNALKKKKKEKKKKGITSSKKGSMGEGWQPDRERRREGARTL